MLAVYPAMRSSSIPRGESGRIDSKMAANHEHILLKSAIARELGVIGSKLPFMGFDRYR